MKNYFFLLIFAILFSKSIFAQTNNDDRIIAFHPLSGKTIDVHEKKKYTIFNEYNDSVFEIAQLVKHSNGSYSILVKTKSGKSIEKPASIAELDAIYASIEKIDPANIQAKSNIVEYDTEKRSDEERRIRRTENAILVGDIALRTFFVLIDILFALAQAAN